MARPAYFCETCVPDFGAHEEIPLKNITEKYCVVCRANENLHLLNSSRINIRAIAAKRHRKWDMEVLDRIFSGVVAKYLGKKDA